MGRQCETAGRVRDYLLAKLATDDLINPPELIACLRVLKSISICLSHLSLVGGWGRGCEQEYREPFAN